MKYESSIPMWDSFLLKAKKEKWDKEQIKRIESHRRDCQRYESALEKVDRICRDLIGKP